MPRGGKRPFDGSNSSQRQPAQASQSNGACRPCDGKAPEEADQTGQQETEEMHVLPKREPASALWRTNANGMELISDEAIGSRICNKLGCAVQTS